VIILLATHEIFIVTNMATIRKFYNMFEKRNVSAPQSAFRGISQT